MKIGKLILPILVVAVAAMVYFVYLAPKNQAGDFSKFDTNSKTNLEIKVTLFSEDGQIFARDGKGKTVLFNCDTEVPAQALSGGLVTVQGHLHEDHFHAVEIKMP